MNNKPNQTIQKQNYNSVFEVKFEFQVVAVAGTLTHDTVNQSLLNEFAEIQ